MKVKNTKENREIQQAADSLAIEGMYLDEEFLKYYMDARERGMSHEDICQEIIKKHKQ